jgi:tRNA (guanine37-N1)-methyltransferase
MPLRIDIISANPAITESSLSNGLISRAITKCLAEVFVHHLRDYAEGKYRQIDDEPYGGGAGMVLKPDPIFRCVRKLQSERNYDEIIYLSPQGVRYNQRTANFYSLKNNLIIICGHYKGIDERVISKLVTAEISIGDYVLSCGDIAAIVFTDSVARLIPGVLGDGESAITDTFQVETGFDFPQYTRPEIYDNFKVPSILLSGNHSEIAKWRQKKALAKYRNFKKINKY